MSQFNKQPKYSIRKFKVGVCSTVIAFSFLASGGVALADEEVSTVNLETTEATRSSDTSEITTNTTSDANGVTESVNSSNLIEEKPTSSADVPVESVETTVASSSDTTVSESASTVATTSSAIETEVIENTRVSSSAGVTREANSEQPSRANSDGISGSVVEVAKESLAISGNSEVYQDGETPEKLLDGDPVTLAELKWDIDENRRLPEEIKLPQPVTFSFNNGEAVDLESLKIFKRINANGTLTKYRVTGFNGDDEVYSSGDIVTDFSEEIAAHILTQPTKVSHVQLTFLEAKNSAAGAVDNQKLSLKEVELYSNNGQKIDSSSFSVSGNENVYETTYGAGLDKLTDGNLDTLAELKWDYGSNRKLPDTVSLPQDITLSTKDGSAIVLNKLEILKRAGSNGTLTKYRVQAFNGEESVYRSEDVTTDFAEEVASHDLGNVTANKVVITFLEAKNSADGAVDKQKLTLRELKLYEFKATETETPAEQPVENPTETPTDTEDTYVKPANALGAISSLTFENDRATIHFATGQKAQLDLYNNHVFRYNIENGDATFVDTPEPSRADRPAEIAIKKLADYKKDGSTLGRLSQDDKAYTIETDAIKLVFDKATARMSVYDQTGKLITKEVVPVQMTAGSAVQTLSQAADEYFFGGGMQNGRFTHKGNKISIVNENNWVDGGVASPNPFYWSTRGYGVLRNTFKPGSYDFGTTNKSAVETTHNESRYDAFFFINTTPANIIKDYQELTGTPVVLPEYALYLGHLNAYNRDYWVEVPEGTRGAIKLEGKYYREYQPNQLPEADRAKAVKETLNGEGESYTFSARAVIDRYKNMDMPVAWFLPNDGYGAGYGQADSLEGNIQNLKKFVEYAKQNGIKVGLWTQSDLYDTDPSKAVVLHRNIEKEVADAGIRAIKTDVAWVGPGYSFGLNGVTTGAALLTEKSGENARPFIISLDGWGGTQRGAAIWSGDQVGGEWEYIRFHIPTYIGLGLSGNPNMGSDMDGIFGGGNAIINAREYQWKMFTSIMMNMDGWGANPKTPFAFDDKTTDLNRISLKTKSTLTPYAYSTGHQAAETGKPIVRAMFLDYPSDAINYTKAVQYQYMYGDYFLVAPIYEETAMDSEGNDIRNNIYLPEGVEWIDFYTGEKYEGGRVLNGFDAPLWKIPVFVKNGAIIPMANANNNPSEIDRSNRLVQFYPHKSSEFKLYEDDGTSEGYKTGEVATTIITSQAGDSNTKGTAVLTFGKTSGDFTGFVKEKTTELHVNVSEDVDSVTARIGDRDVTLTRVNSLEDYENGTNVFFYHKNPTMATYGARSEAIQNLTVTMNDLVKIKLEKTDVTQSEVIVTIDGFINKKVDKEVDENLAIPAVPTDLATPVAYVTATDIKVTWTASEGADAYDLRHNGIVYSNIKATEFSFGDLDYGSSHTFEVRAVNAKGASDWSAPLTTQTSQDPWLNAIDIDPAKVETNIRQQPGEGIDKLFNKKKGDMFHSDWNSSVSSDSYIKVDLGGVYDLDYLEYRQRSDGGLNGRVQWTNFWISEDGVNWTPSGGEDWRGDGISKKHVLNAKARYVYMAVTSSYNGFISGEEMLIFKKPGTKMAVPGDINNDGKITEDDKTSFLNYTGLRKSDSDFDYIKHVDVNGNGLIDAQDINVIATQLEGGVTSPQTVAPSGRLYLTADKLTLKAGETAVVTLMADEVANTNALTSTFKIDAGALSVVGNQVTPNTEFTKEAENFSNVKTREGKTDVVFTFVNFGDKPLLSGSGAVATVTLKALSDVTLDFTSNEGILVGNNQAAAKVANEPVRQAVHYTGPATTPTNVTVTRPTQGSLTLTWDNDAQVLRYVVEKEVTAEDGSKSYVEVARVETNSADIYNLLPDTAYNFRVKAVNPLGTSEATELISGRTTVKDVTGRATGITATAEVASQAGQEVSLFVDGSEDTQYHSEWYNTRAVPSSLVLDLGASKELDHLVYVPRRDAGNGTITSLTLQVSEDGETWSAATPVIKWDQNNTDKVALLPVGSQGRYVKVNWLSSVGGFASGQELYVLTKASEVAPNPDPNPTPTPVPEEPAVVEEWIEELYPVPEEPAVVEEWVDELYPVPEEPAVVEEWIDELYPVSEEPAVVEEWIEELYPVAEEPAMVEEWVDELYPVAEEPAVVEEWVDELYPVADDTTVVEDWSEDIAPEVLEATQVVTLTNQVTGVTVHLTVKPSEVAGLRLEVTPTSVTQVAPILDDNLETQDLDIYDIHFVNASGEVVTVEGSRQVILPKRANRDIEAVYYVNPTQEDESLDYTVLSDTSVSVTVDHFSFYTIVYKPLPTTTNSEFVESDYTRGEDIITDAVSYDDYEIVIIVDGQTVQTSHFKNITYDTLLAGLSALAEAKLAEGLSYDSTGYDGQVVTMTFSSGVTAEWVDDAYVSSNAEEATVDTKKAITEVSGEGVDKLKTDTQSKSDTLPAATEVSSQKAQADEKGTLPATGDASAYAYMAFGVASLLGATALGKRRRN
ncbi:discoidin domain-containing protein [Streptococcus caprae]|uniref:Discoidin domain-containing protein n=1 Tax=Streptococcus caprae TaxID=1640501 RepID=A0ABV8CV37_9STRE